MKEYKIKVNGNEYAVSVGGVENDVAQVVVNGTEYAVEVEGMRQSVVSKTPKIVQSPVVPTVDSHPATQNTSSPAVTAAAGAGDLRSPLPGVILDVMVSEGDTVKMGQRLMLLEAMKMENNIDADRDGVVRSIKVRKGDSVLEGDVLLTIG